MAEERLQKILARAGVASRRKAEEIIVAGRVRVDGRVVTELGAKADPKKCDVELDGRKLRPEPFCYGVLHKPRGMVTTLSDPEGRPTAREVLRQVGVRVVPVGRLDFNTSGVLLFTNDGDFAQKLQHASGHTPKVYAAKVTQEIDEKNLEKWSQSIAIEGKQTRPASVRILRREGKKTWLEVTIAEGRNRQVRRLGEHAGTPVERLSRLSHAGITTEGLRPGQWRLLTVDELKDLKKKYGVPEKIRGIFELSDAKGRRSAPGWSTRPPTADARSALSRKADSGKASKHGTGSAGALKRGTAATSAPKRGTATTSATKRGGPDSRGRSEATTSGRAQRGGATSSRGATLDRGATSSRGATSGRGATSSRGAKSAPRSRKR